MDYKNYLQTKKGLTPSSEIGKKGLKLSGALLLSLGAVQTDAQVIVTNVAPANQVVTNGVYPVNVDGAGGAEFSISVGTNIFMNLNAGVQFQGSGGGPYGYPYKLGAAAVVNSSNQTLGGSNANSITYSGTFGNWNDDTTTGYIGFQFNIGVNVHYGWIELCVVDAVPGPNQVTIKRWAYEATPNTQILTGATPLPVVLAKFIGRHNAGVNLLNWVTQKEENHNGFEIQRSADGKTFEKIGFVASAGNTSEMQQYHYTDMDVKAIDYYYRLKEISDDNTFNFSSIIRLMADEVQSSGIDLLSNPVRNGRLEFNYNATNEGTLTIDLFDVNGKLIHHQTEDMGNGSRSFSIDLSNSAAGIYYLKCQQNNKSGYEKIIVE